MVVILFVSELLLFCSMETVMCHFFLAGKELSENDWYWLKKEVGRNKWTIIDHYGISGEKCAYKIHFELLYIRQIFVTNSAISFNDEN